jgi:hypothetical protein
MKQTKSGGRTGMDLPALFNQINGAGKIHAGNPRKIFGSVLRCPIRDALAGHHAPVIHPDAAYVAATIEEKGRLRR